MAKSWYFSAAVPLHLGGMVRATRFAGVDGVATTMAALLEKRADDTANGAFAARCGCTVAYDRKNRRRPRDVTLRSGQAFGAIFAGAFIARCNIPLHS
jgi:hypothetical protein